jgi:hypothetical protein
MASVISCMSANDLSLLVDATRVYSVLSHALLEYCVFSYVCYMYCTAKRQTLAVSLIVFTQG